MKPTADDVRRSYEDRGYLVRIDSDGHVEYRETSDDAWLEGRWVSEYRFDESHIGGLALF